MKPKILTKAETDTLRRQVALRDNFHCILCGKPATSIHHVIYRSFTKSGSATIWREKNMASLCSECHNECHQHPLKMRRKLLERMAELHPEYDYSDRLWQQYLIEEET